MFSNINDDGESMPQLKFKVPNFIGTLTERKRPVFVEAPVSDEQSTAEQPLQHREPSKPNESVKRLETSQLKAPTQTAPIKQTPLSDSQSQSMKHQVVNVASAHHKFDEEVSLKSAQAESIQQPRYHEPEPAQHHRNSDKSVDQNYSPYNRNEAHSISQQHNTNNPFIEEGARVEHRSSSYSLEADQYLNQIVTILAHFRSLGKRAADSVTQLEARLSIEKDNCNQQKSLLELERQAKAMVQEELQSTRDVISQLTEKLSKVHQDRLHLERSRIEDENERWQLKKELDSANIEKELSKNELEHLHANLQDLERSLVSISEERTLLNSELATQKARMVEHEQNLSAEIDKSNKNCTELQECFDGYKATSMERIKVLESEKAALESERASFTTFVRNSCSFLELDPNSSVDSVLESIKRLSLQRNQVDSSASQLIEELKSSLEQKQQALDHLQGRIEELGLKMQISDQGHCDAVSDLEKKNRELQAAYDAVMIEAKSLKGVSSKIEEYEKFFTSIRNKIPNPSEVSSFEQVLEIIMNWKGESDAAIDEKAVEELRSNVKRQQEAFSSEKNNWEAERHRLVAERLKLIQENEALKRQQSSKGEPKTPVQTVSPSGETATESIMRAIEADLKKAKGSKGSIKQTTPDDTWTVSDSTVKSPLKRVTASSRSSMKKKKIATGSLVRESPLKGQSGNSELDFWAFAK